MSRPFRALDSPSPAAGVAAAAAAAVAGAASPPPPPGAPSAASLFEMMEFESMSPMFLPRPSAAFASLAPSVTSVPRVDLFLIANRGLGGEAAARGGEEESAAVACRVGVPGRGRVPLRSEAELVRRSWISGAENLRVNLFAGSFFTLGMKAWHCLRRFGTFKTPASRFLNC